MNKEEWHNYKNNCIKMTWWWPTREWVQELLNFPLINFLNKFHRGGGFLL